MLSLSHTLSPTLLLRHKNRALLFLPPLLLLLLPSFQNTSKWSRIKRHTEIELLCSRTIQIQNKNCCHNGASRSRKEVVSLLSERLRQGKPIQNGSGNSSFRLLQQGKPIQKRSFSFRTLPTTEQVGREQKTDLFQKPCDNGNRSRQEASLAELLRQRSNSVQTRSISCRTLATAEQLGPEKKHHLFQNSCDKGSQCREEDEVPVSLKIASPFVPAPTSSLSDRKDQAIIIHATATRCIPMMYCANNTTARKIAHSLPIFLDTYRRRRGFHSQSVSKLADVFPALLLLLVTDLAGGRSSFLHYRELRNSLRSWCRRLHRSLRLWKLRRKYAKMWERSHTKKSRFRLSLSLSLSLSPPLKPKPRNVFTLRLCAQ